MRQGASIRRRMLAAFVLLALGMGLTLGLVGLFSYDMSLHSQTCRYN